MTTLIVERQTWIYVHTSYYMYSRWWFDTSFFLPLPGKNDSLWLIFVQLGWNQHIFADMSKTDSPLSVLRINFGLPNLGRSFSPEPSWTRLWELKLWLYTLRKINDEFVVGVDPQKIEMLRLLTRIPRDFPRDFPMISYDFIPGVAFADVPSQYLQQRRDLLGHPTGALPPTVNTQWMGCMGRGDAMLVGSWLQTDWKYTEISLSTAI